MPPPDMPKNFRQLTVKQPTTPLPNSWPLLTPCKPAITKATTAANNTLGVPLLRWSPKEVNAVNTIQDNGNHLDAIGTRHANTILGESVTTNVALELSPANTNIELPREPACAS